MNPAAGLQAAGPVPVMKLDHTAPELLDEMIEAVARVASAGAFTLGHEVEAFEAEFAAYMETTHCVGVSSGTEALVLALRALDVGPGDEVIVPANSFIATAEAVSLVGATPRPIDVDPQSHLMTAAGVEAAIGPRTRCVIPVHLMGATVDMAPILAVAREHEMSVVEDTAQAHGARLRGRRVGTFGDVGCFSFYPTKNLGAWGDGGAIVTADDELADRVRLLRCHGERPRYHHRMVGTTARLDALQAAVLRIKLRDLDAVTDERRRLGAALCAGLRTTSVGMPIAACDGADHVYHLFVVRGAERDALREHLSTEGVCSAIHYPVPIHRVEAYADLRLGAGSLPVAERLAEQICTLPLFPGMSEEQTARVVQAVQGFDRRDV
ncbi:MAG TPA: DegT/DnrJ/EryC1/StrS family aminotransferase [Solirubrobacteraceae bacterium]|nr:DegT/DnrJ/EryC1/StrS family aminotransferase [Solirubrobacteraceae bacterium]